VTVAVKGRIMFSELATKLAACASGLGIAQTIEFGLEPLLARGELVQVLPEWAEERFRFMPTTLLVICRQRKCARSSTSCSPASRNALRAKEESSQ